MHIVRLGNIGEEETKENAKVVDAVPTASIQTNGNAETAEISESISSNENISCVQNSDIVSEKKDTVDDAQTDIADKEIISEENADSESMTDAFIAEAVDDSENMPDILEESVSADNNEDENMVYETAVNAVYPSSIFSSPIATHFLSCGYRIVEANIPKYVSGLEELTALMAKSYYLTSDFIKALKNAISHPNKSGERNIEYKLKGQEIEDKAVKRLAAVFAESGVLCRYSLNSRTNTITGMITPTKRVISFLNGAWLEIWSNLIIRKTVEEFAKKLNLPYEILSNVKLMNSSGTKFLHEIDTAFSIGNTTFAYECKGGTFKDYLTIYSTGKELGIVPDHYILMTANLTDNNRADTLQYFYEYYIANMNNFADKLLDMITKSFDS